MTNIEKLGQIKEVAKMCRNAQIMYFKERTYENLIKAKQFEAKLDELINEYDEIQLSFEI